MPLGSDQPHRKKVKHYDNGEPHFLTVSCYQRRPLLSKDRTRLWFVDALSEARTLHGFHLWAWVIMPEHVHLLLWPSFASIDPESTRGRIRGILSSLKKPVGELAIDYLRQHAPAYLRRLRVQNENRTYHRFWQPGSGHDENVSDPRALHALVDYVHLNPVRRGLVERAENWPWSSARDWLQMDHSVLSVDRTLPETLEIPWVSRHMERSG